MSVDRRPSAETWLSALLESSVDVLVVCDPHGKVLAWNPAAERLYGYAATETIGRSFMTVVPPEQIAASHAVLARVRRGVAVRGYEVVHRRKDGTLVEVAIHLSPVHGEGGTMQGFLCIVRDIADRKREEVERARLQVELERVRAQLRHMQRIGALGTLTGGVAHDFRNMLCIVRSYAELVLEALPPDDPLREDVAAIGEAGRRAAELTRQLLAFGRGQVLVPSVVDPNELVTDMARMLRRVVGDSIDVVTHLARGVDSILVDSGQLEQVLVNLGTNARDAMPDGGTLTIETRAVAGGVRLAVSDTGCGMDEATRERMFEPFFTTKDKEKGTGLGLAMVHGIVQQSGGHIEVRSAPGEGTTVSIDLPRSHTRVSAAPPEAAPSSRRSAKLETVLLVEDDDEVRRAAATILRRKGYEVLEAANAGEALLAFEERGDSVDLLLSDVSMPRMSGPQLAKRLLQRRATLPVLFMTGQPDHPALHDGVRDGGVVLLHKPFTPASLAGKVREALDAPEAVSAPASARGRRGP